MFVYCFFNLISWEMLLVAAHTEYEARESLLQEDFGIKKFFWEIYCPKKHGEYRLQTEGA